MSAHPPPVPPANRSPKGPGSDPQPGEAEAAPQRAPDNLGEQSRQGNVKQNTTNKGFEQDR